MTRVAFSVEHRTYLIPENASLRVPTVVFQTPVQFIGLGGRQWRLVAFGSDIFPQSLGQFHPLGERKSFCGLK